MADLHVDPFRLRVMVALCAVIENITIANGYKHDLTGAVFRGRNLFGSSEEEADDGDPIPMVSILEVPIQPEQIEPPRESDKGSGLWDLTFQGFCRDDKKNPTDPAYRLAADVVKALAIAKNAVSASRYSTGKSTPLLGIKARNGNPAITDLLVGSPVCRPPDDISGKAYFWLPVSLRLAENLEDPYG